uniref:Poly (ADP-ribose) polymerase family, member 12a n=1 Tax=Hucho hucho TaxID=62062 RepID=A0A4W5R591_9TELE
MSSVVSQYVTKMLCGNHGCLDFKQLDQIVGQKFTVADEVLLGILRDRGKYAISEGEGKASRLDMSQSSVIVAKTSLRVCQSPPGDCLQCENLHLCRYFVCGNCRFGNKCKNSHSLDSPHNTALIRSVGHHDLGEAELFPLLLQNDPYLMPEICSHYNKGVGEHGSCKFKTSCTSLHLCLHFIQGDCKFGVGCKRAHTFDATTMKILNGRGFSQENIRILDKIYNNKFIIIGQGHKEKPSVLVRMKSAFSSSADTAASKFTVLRLKCLHVFLWLCVLSEKCVRIHYHLPYKWQILERDGVTWRDLPNVEEIEKAYCIPGKDTRYKWLWYWADELGQWIEYGQEMYDGKEKVASVTSQTLENVYQADSDREIPFGSGHHQYILYFKEMYQQNVRFKTKREVRRRPCFLSGQDVEAKLKSGSPESTSSSTVSVPPHWDKGALPDFTYKLVPLLGLMTEYQMVQSLFKRTMPTSTIHKINRIQNPSLWRVFQWYKEQMKVKNGGKLVDERHLFHGTELSIVDAICEQNFDWRVCGIHGSHYGKGSYFARDAVYSDRFSKSPVSGKKIMFVALVLVGEFTKGNRDYLRPPQKGTSKGLYDSCVDSESNPAIFVVFEKQQIYPEFIIEYS